MGEWESVVDQTPWDCLRLKVMNLVMGSGGVAFSSHLQLCYWRGEQAKCQILTRAATLLGAQGGELWCVPKAACNNCNTSAGEERR